MRGSAASLAILALLALPVMLAGCPSSPDTGCVKDITSGQCKNQCQQLGSCSPCAASPDCGWCGASGTGGQSGVCLPATLGENKRNQRPPACSGDWFYRTADPGVPPGAPFCPAIPVTGPENNGAQLPSDGGSS